MRMWTEPVESEKTLKGPSRVGENPVRSSARDLGQKIAKMGWLLVVFRQIPEGSFQGCWTDEIRADHMAYLEVDRKNGTKTVSMYRFATRSQG